MVHYSLAIYFSFFVLIQTLMIPLKHFIRPWSLRQTVNISLWTLPSEWFQFNVFQAFQTSKVSTLQGIQLKTEVVFTTFTHVQGHLSLHLSYLLWILLISLTKQSVDSWRARPYSLVTYSPSTPLATKYPGLKHILCTSFADGKHWFVVD